MVILLDALSVLVEFVRLTYPAHTNKHKLGLSLSIYPPTHYRAVIHFCMAPDGGFDELLCGTV